MDKRLTIIVIVIALLCMQQQRALAQPQDGSAKSVWDEVYSKPGQVTYTDDRSRCGTESIRFEVRLDEGPLDELGLHSDVRKYDAAVPGTTQWVSFSTYLPATSYELDAFDSGHPDRLDYAWIMQVFVRDTTTDPVISSPVLALVYNELGEWSIASYSGNVGNESEPPRIWHLGPRSDWRDQWIDWVIEIRWDAGSDGRITVWRNGKQFGPYNGPNWYATYGPNETQLPTDIRGRLILGVYANRWRGLLDLPSNKSLRSKAVYIDEVVISDRWSGREDMRPCD